MLSFANPMMLYGLLALGLPVLIHLSRWRAVNRVVFPSLRFISRSKMPKSGWPRLRDPLLLLARMCLLAALAVLFARPERNTRSAESAPAPGRAVMLVDASPSMAGWGTPERLPAAVSALLRSRPGLEWTVIAAGAAPELVLDGGGDHDEILAAAGGVTAGQRGADIAAALELVGGGLLAVVSDFHSADWNLAKLPTSGVWEEVELVEIGGSPLSNCAVVGAVGEFAPGGGARITAELRNFGGRREFGELSARLEDGALVSSKVELPPHGSPRVVLELEGVSRPQAAELRLEVSGDPYHLDDTFSVWLEDSPPIRILFVAPFSHEPEKAEEMFFINQALSVAAAGSPWRFELGSVDSEIFEALPLDSADGLILAGAAGYFGDGDFKRLRGYLENRGFAIITPGRAPGGQFLALRRHGLFEAGFNGLVDHFLAGSRTSRLASLDRESFLGGLFADVHSTDLLLLPVFKYADFTVPGDAEVLLTMDNGKPFLARRRVGRNWLVASAVAFTPRWSDLPLSGSFLPLLRELVVDSLAAAPHQTQDIVCGENLPDGTAAREPGAFDAGGVPVQVNVCRGQSGLERIPPARVAAALIAEGHGEGTASGAAVAAAARSELLQRRELWPWVLVLAVALGAAESLLANRRRGELN